MKRNHVENTVGPWAANKLDALEEYLKFYSTALSKKSFTRVYIDAFAGSCESKIRRKQPEINSFFDDAEDSQAQDEFISGSPIRAMSIKHQFHRYYFFDLDESRVERLRSLGKDYNHQSVYVEFGDCNPMIQDLAATLGDKGVRGVAFLDPYGAHLHWTTIESLAETKNFEVIINFPIAMAINRLITKSGDIPENWKKQITSCFGTGEWHELAYSRQDSLFGDEFISKKSDVSRSLLDLYVRRLKKLFNHVAAPHLIRNTRGNPLYYLIWAGPNKLGLKGAEYILGQGEKCGSRR